MPRESKTPITEDQAKAFDAFALAKGSVPKPFDTPIRKDVTVEPQTPVPPKQTPAKRAPKAAPEQPPVRRIRSGQSGRNVQFNQNVSPVTANHFYDTRAKLNVTMGEVLERAIIALMEKIEREGERR